MDGSRFDVWTRRQFGVAAGGFVASLLGLAQLDTVRAKKHHHKKRCKKLLKSCNPDGRKCCHGNRCESFDRSVKDSFHCCKPENESCQSGEECCLGLVCQKEIGSDQGVCVVP